MGKYQQEYYTDLALSLSLKEQVKQLSLSSISVLISHSTDLEARRRRGHRLLRIHRRSSRPMWFRLVRQYFGRETRRQAEIQVVRLQLPYSSRLFSAQFPFRRDFGSRARESGMVRSIRLLEFPHVRAGRLHLRRFIGRRSTVE
uniref:Uncharacterized protein MANES_12G110600 n=1 Tax=Rhizophora mucronata TaxID=61149 RepID=A0A2P2L5X0_RHIMU